MAKNRRISTEGSHRNLLILLLATCEAALERFKRGEARVHDTLVRDLERVIAGAQRVLEGSDGEPGEARARTS